VCVFPGHFLLRNDLHVTPHLLGKSYPFSLQQIIKWAFVAPPDDVADELQRMGHQAAIEWAKTGGIEEGREIDLAEVVEPDKVVGTSVVRPGPVVGLGTSSGSGVDVRVERKQHAHGDTEKEGKGEAVNKLTDIKSN
jgi:hypothetical protein